jgi:hypothetical protein
VIRGEFYFMPDCDAWYFLVGDPVADAVLASGSGDTFDAVVRAAAARRRVAPVDDARWARRFGAAGDVGAVLTSRVDDRRTTDDGSAPLAGCAAEQTPRISFFVSNGSSTDPRGGQASAEAGSGRASPWVGTRSVVRRRDP